ncbi:MAG TPA: cyclopropane-fatty-acyl-phospholipid synthase family protein [Kofleriaceae bacterium]|nr:cyclopropane-fatty-acyl-phospholipid synthase family protein [Kofleriaceae bacterium]
MLQRIVDSGWLPEPVLRAGIRAVCALRLRQERRRPPGYAQALVAELRASEIAIASAAANAQHYEVPAAFFARVLGPHMKYSSCYWPEGVETLGAAEQAMLELTAERAGLADGQAVLDLGCGWGALTLWAAARFPASRFTAVSHSRSQRDHIAEQARQRGLGNVTVQAADVRTAVLPAGGFDRVVSIEMFEHMRNYAVLLRRIAGWLAPGGALFVHVFAHRRHAYPFEDAGASDWMAREFFTGGLMPSVALLRAFQDDLAITCEWQLDGTHYARTAEAWYANLMAHRAEATAVLGDPRKLERWRVFFLACAELFGYRGGREWGVAHYRFEPRRAGGQLGNA